MIYLTLAIISSTAVSVFMKLFDKHIKNNMVMFSANYFICGVLSYLFEVISKGNRETALISTNNGIMFTVIFGIFSGVMYLISFILLQFNINRNGVILSATFMKLGVVVPIIMSITAFKEIPTIFQLIGILMALISIIIINTENKENNKEQKVALTWLILLLLLGGLTDATSNIYEKLGNPGYKDKYLLFIFISAMLVSVSAAIYKRQKVTKMDIISGMMIGIPNYFSSRFLLYSLSEVPAIVAYPIYNVAVIMLIALIGRLIFKEKLSKRKYIGMVIISGAIIMLNI